MNDTPHVHFFSDSWAQAMARDIAQASKSILSSALSMLPPTTTARGPWPEIWAAYLTAIANSATVELWLPAPQLAHPATRANGTSARYAHLHGIIVHQVPGPRLLHAKSCVIDNNIAWIGSGNLTAAAAGPNHEFWCRVQQHQFAQRVTSALHELAAST